jgi:hypothetical protein
MSRGSSAWICACFVSVAFLTGATATAQSPNYHLEYVPDGAQRTWIVLVNDSPNTIEFVSLLQECSLVRQGTVVDALDRPEYSLLIRDAANNLSRSIGPEQGGTWELLFFENSEKSKYVGECAPRVEFILFGDGTYEGKESYAHYLKTQRDGMFASVIEWLEILNRKRADESSAIELEKMAGQRRDKEAQKVLEYCKPGRIDCEETARLVAGFWAGKWEVDAAIGSCIHVSEMAGRDWCENDRPPGQVVQYTMDYLERWKSKIEEDPAMKRLREIFPPSAPAVDKRNPS